jgi:hypothetical protein
MNTNKPGIKSILFFSLTTWVYGRPHVSASIGPSLSMFNFNTMIDYDVPTRSSKLHPEQDSKTIVDSTYGSSSSSRQPSTEHSFSTPSNVPTTVSLPERYRQPPFPWRSIKDSKAVDFPPPQGEPDDLNPYPSFPHLGLDAPAVDHAYSKTFAGLDRRGMDNTFPTSDRMFQGYHTELIRRERSPEQLDHSERGTPNLNTMALALNENTQQRKKMTNEPLFQTTR